MYSFSVPDFIYWQFRMESEQFKNGLKKTLSEIKLLFKGWLHLIDIGASAFC